MGLFDKIKEPVIFKEDSSATQQLAELEQLLARETDPKIKAMIETDIGAVRAGIYGENIILFELKNSHMPMYVLHDLYLEFGGLTAQIDFLVITRKCIFVIECKNLYGDITINNSGDFIRNVAGKKEGIYSPVTQGKRHMELLKQIRSAERGNILTKTFFERGFNDIYQSVIVLANPKTVLDTKYAPKEIKNQVIRADHLIEHIQKVNSNSDFIEKTENYITELANYFLSKHQVCKTDYLEKYHRPIQQTQENPEPKAKPNTPEIPLCPLCGAPMVKRKATKGANAGSEFWGCSGYPNCKGIINIV